MGGGLIFAILIKQIFFLLMISADVELKRQPVSNELDTGNFICHNCMLMHCKQGSFCMILPYAIVHGIDIAWKFLDQFHISTYFRVVTSKPFL